MRIGYARVSTASGTKAERAELQRALEFARDSDALILLPSGWTSTLAVRGITVAKRERWSNEGETTACACNLGVPTKMPCSS